MASFTERYHEVTKYNPNTIDKVGAVDWENQPKPFKDVPKGRSQIDLVPYLNFLKEGPHHLDWTPHIQPLNGPVQSLEDLALMLYCTGGITGLMPSDQGHHYFRANPSAGGLYPIEVYVAVRNIEGISDGLYHYHPEKNILVDQGQSAFWSSINGVFQDQACIDTTNMLLIYTGLFARSDWRYKERAYRRILLDSGHIAANTLMFCEQRQVPVQIIGGFLDTVLEECMSIAHLEEVPLLALSFSPSVEISPLASISQTPAEAAKRVNPHHALQVQQNTVERIVGDFHVPAESLFAKDLDSLNQESLHLPDLKTVGFNATQMIILRRSTREFVSEQMSKEVLSEILEFSFSRYVHEPLSGAFLKHWLLIRNVEGLENAVYRYFPFENKLIFHKNIEDWDKVSEAALSQRIALDSNVVLVQSCNLNRATAAYGDRIYRYLCMDSGRIGEYINLIANHLGYGSSGIGGYYDDLVNDVMNIEHTEGILYMTSIGKSQAP
jgi:SagB-type dehydrogenase family enzyme